jgi:hypothetical protein
MDIDPHQQQMPDEGDLARAAVLGWIRSGQIDRKADCFKRGRRFQSSPLDDLKKQWLKAFGSWVRPDGRSLDAQMVTLANDIEAELSLRGEEPPYEKAQGAMNVLEQAVMSAYREAQRDPERYEEAKRRAYADFLSHQEAAQRGH